MDNNIRWQPYYYISRGIVYEDDLKNIADALIAAGIGDVKRHRVFVSKDGSIKQLYSGEEVEKIAREREEYKHHAEVVERAGKIAASKVFDYTYEEAVAQTEKELAEERKE